MNVFILVRTHCNKEINFLVAVHCSDYRHILIYIIQSVVAVTIMHQGLKWNSNYVYEHLHGWLRSTEKCEECLVLSHTCSLLNLQQKGTQVQILYWILTIPSRSHVSKSGPPGKWKSSVHKQTFRRQKFCFLIHKVLKCPLNSNNFISQLLFFYILYWNFLNFLFEY